MTIISDFFKKDEYLYIISKDSIFDNWEDLISKLIYYERKNKIKLTNYVNVNVNFYHYLLNINYNLWLYLVLLISFGLNYTLFYWQNIPLSMLIRVILTIIYIFFIPGFLIYELIFSVSFITLIKIIYCLILSAMVFPLYVFLINFLSWKINLYTIYWIIFSFNIFFLILAVLNNYHLSKKYSIIYEEKNRNKKN